MTAGSASLWEQPHTLAAAVLCGSCTQPATSEALLWMISGHQMLQQSAPPLKMKAGAGLIAPGGVHFMACLGSPEGDL